MAGSQNKLYSLNHKRKLIIFYQIIYENFLYKRKPLQGSFPS
jgi:hypothetical protein